MEAFLEGYLDEMARLHKEMKSVIADVDPDALDWRPGEGTNSLAVLATHVAGSERYWIGELVMGEPAYRVRQEEFKAANVRLEQLAGALDDSLELIRRGLEGVSIQRVEDKVVLPRGGEPVTVAWALAHVLQHTALHLGHMELTRQLIDLRDPREETPSIGG
jgi:uncharacterized damage-inducible protein DinB